MKKNYSTQPAQIGIAAVLLTTILLAIGVSVTTRVSNQVSQETQRTESQQALESAVGQVDIASQDRTLVGDTTRIDTDTDTDVENKVDTAQISNATDGQSIYLNAGETVEIKLSNVPKKIFWEISDNNACNDKTSPALLLGHYKTDGTVDYYPVTGFNCEANGNRAGYERAEADSGPFRNSYDNSNFTSGTLRIKVLYGGTYLKMDGLITTIRAAASNEDGDEVRVVEQYQTSENAAPSIMDFALFAGGGSITKQ